MIYRFDTYTLDDELLELRANGEVSEVEPQVFSLITYLINNREKVVSKDDLIDAVWKGRIVSDATLNSRINVARKILGDDGKSQAVIKTFPRRGFRFVAEVNGCSETVRIPTSASDKPSVVVLPFANLSGDPEQEYFSDGITDDIITALSHIRWFFVIARNSSFSFKGQSPDVRDVAAQLGVRYVLEGSIRKAGNRVRITAQLVDGESGNHLWAESYDRELEDIFAVQDEITRTVVGSIEPELAKAERYKANSCQPKSLSAWENYQRGMWHFYQLMSPESRDQADAFLLNSIELDPNFGPAYSALAHNSYTRMINGWSESPDELDSALEFAKKAVELDNTDAHAHASLGIVYVGRREHERAIRECKIAISLNPSSFFGHLSYGAALVYSGNFEAAIPILEMALRLSPHDPHSAVPLARLAEAYMCLGEYELAVEMAELAATKPRRGIWIHTARIAALAHAGRIDDAKLAYPELIDRQPNFSCAYLRENLPSNDPHYIEIYIEGLRKAGVPESQ